jgi:hypothetical protein
VRWCCQYWIKCKHCQEAAGDEQDQSRVSAIPSELPERLAAGLAPPSGEVVTEFQLDSLRTDSLVRILMPSQPVRLSTLLRALDRLPSWASWLAWQLGAPAVFLHLYVIMDSNPLRCRTDELRLVGHAAPPVVEGIMVLAALDAIDRVCSCRMISSKVNLSGIVMLARSRMRLQRLPAGAPPVPQG